MPAALLPSLLLEATVAAAAAMTIESVHDHAISAIYYYVDLATLDARLRSTAQAACRAREDAAPGSAPRSFRGSRRVRDPLAARPAAGLVACGGILAQSEIRVNLGTSSNQGNQIWSRLCVGLCAGRGPLTQPRSDGLCQGLRSALPEHPELY